MRDLPIFLGWALLLAASLAAWAAFVWFIVSIAQLAAS